MESWTRRFRQTRNIIHEKNNSRTTCRAWDARRCVLVDLLFSLLLLHDTTGSYNYGRDAFPLTTEKNN